MTKSLNLAMGGSSRAELLSIKIIMGTLDSRQRAPHLVAGHRHLAKRNIGYDGDAEIAHAFHAMMQNKFLSAITG